MRELVDATIADGVVDAEEVQTLRDAVYADGTVDKEEVEALFEINNAVSGNANDPAWGNLMVEAVCDYALKDDVSPGVVDADEGKFLAGLIMGDEVIDTVETAILVALRDKATSIESVELTALIDTI